MRSKFRKTLPLITVIIMSFIISPVRADVYYQEFSVLAGKEVIISFEPQFLNCSVIIAPVGNLKYTYFLTTSQFKFIPHDNGTYVIRITGPDVYNETLTLVYVINAYGKVVPPLPPSLSLSSEITTVLNKSVVFRYPELSGLNVTVSPSRGVEIKTKTSTSTEILFKEIGRYSVSITGTTKEGSNYSLDVTVDVVNIVNVNVTQQEVKVVTYSIPQWQAFLYLVLFFVPLFGVLAFFYRRSVSLENVMRGVLRNGSTPNVEENKRSVGEGSS